MKETEFYLTKKSISKLMILHMGGSRENEKEHGMKIRYDIKNKGSENESFNIVLNLYRPVYRYQYSLYRP
jgi:hypothetical protein